MSVKTVQDASLTAIADAIRAKTSASASLAFPDGFASAIAGIETGSDGDAAQEMAIALIQRPTGTSIHLDYITSIASSAFNGFVTLTEAAFPNCSFIGNSAFYNCSKLSRISFPLASNIHAGAFCSCSSLLEIDFPAASGGFPVSGFWRCSCLTRANLPLVTNIGSNCFRDCPSLSEVIAPRLKFVNAYVFSSCSALKSAYFPAAQYVNDRAFAGCIALSSIVIDACSTISNYAFASCAFSEINLPVCTNLSSYAFLNCANLNKIVLGASTVCALAHSNAFTGSLIPTEGYIYVPSSLLASYQTATNWRYHSSRLSAIEDMA